jgi:hypothetical protein
LEETLMKVLRNGFIAALVAVPFLALGGGACTVDAGLGGPGTGGYADVAIGGGCVYDEDCAGAGGYCDNSTGLCAVDIAVGDACVSDDECGVDAYCDPTGVCVVDVAVGAECVTDDECGWDGYCDAGVCATDVAVGGGCTSDVDCAADEYCASDGTCAADVAAGAECTVDDDCVSGVCDNGVCG